MQEAVWLFVRNPCDLQEKEKEELATICQTSPIADTLYMVVQQFMRMIRHLEGEHLDDWLDRVRASHIPELQGFVQSIERDKAAVFAGLTLPYNNGVVEGKRNMLMPRKPALLLSLLNLVIKPIASQTSAPSNQLIVLPQHPPAHDPGAWRAYWNVQGQSWRTEPEIDEKRQKYLAKLRTILPDIEQGIYPFKGTKLNRADVEWLVATHENGRGPIDSIGKTLISQQ